MTERLRHLVATIIDGPPARAVIGPGGSGLTELLDAVAAELADASVARVRGRALDRDQPNAALAPLAEEHDAVLVDDAQWLDGPSARALASRIEGSDRDRTVVAGRPLPRTPEVSELYEALARHGSPIRLDPLDDEQLRERVGERLDAPVADDLLDAVASGSGGSPLVADALVAAWLSTGVIEGGRLAEPTRARGDEIGERLRPRLDALGPAERHLVEVWSFSTALDDPTTAAVAEVPLAELGPLARNVRAAGLLLEGQDEPIPAVADAVLDLLADPDRRRLHRAIAEVSEAQGAPPTQLADHLIDGQVDRPDVVLAAARAVMASDPDQALEWLTHVDGDDPERAATQARASLAQGAFDEALAAADDALVTGTGAARAEALAVEAAVFAERGLWSRAADAYLGISGHPDAPDAHWKVLAVVPLVACGRMREAGEHMTSAEAAIARPASGTLEAALLAGEAMIAAAGGEPGRAPPLLAEAMELAEPVGDWGPHRLLATIAALLGDDETARTALARWHHDDALLPAAWAALRAGRWGDAEAALGSVERPRSTRDDLLEAAVATGMARRRGDLAALTDRWDDVFTALSRTSDDLLVVGPVCELVLVAARLGHAEVARERLGRLQTLVEGIDAPPLFALPVLWTRLLVAAAEEDVDAVAAAADDLAAIPAPPRLAGIPTGARAWTAVLRGDTDDTEVQAAAEALVGAGLVWEASRLVGQAAIRVEDPARTRRLLEAARGVRARLPADEEESASSTQEGLSAREAEVGDLVAAGLTHKEIGAQLYISPKTVEHHVASIRQKLGAATRAEMLAALRS